MLSPKRTKHRKMHRGRRKGAAQRGNTIAFGEFALVAEEACWMTNRQIEAARRAMTRYVKRGGSIWIRIYPDKPYTKKPAETRMGSGKGNPEGWVGVVKPGKVLFEMGGVDEPVARQAMRLAAHKLPIPTRFVSKAAGPGFVIALKPKAAEGDGGSPKAESNGDGAKPEPAVAAAGAEETE